MNSLAVLGINHHQAKVEVREQAACGPARLSKLYQDLNASSFGAVVLSTCNRAEIYFSSPGGDEKDIKARMAGLLLNGHHKELKDSLYFYSQKEAIRHLFRVAASLDSMVIGETQILGQIKDAYQSALNHKTTDKDLNRLFQHSFRVAKRVRTETDIARGNHSVSSLACRLAADRLGGLEDKKAMIIGAGKTGESTLQHLVKRGIKAIFVGNRTFSKAEDLAKRFGGLAVHFKDCFEKMAECNLVICQTSSPHYIIRYGDIPDKRKSPLVLIDLAIPRDIAHEVSGLADVFLYNLDSLQAMTESTIKIREKEVLKAQRIIDEEVRESIRFMSL